MQPLSLLSAFLLASPGGMAPPAQQTLGYEIVNARIELGDGRVIEDGTVIVQDNKIKAVGPSATTTQANTAKIDGKGLTIYPGFIDAYSTSGLKLPEALKSGDNPPDTLNSAPASMWHENRKNIRSVVKAANCLDLKGPFTERYKEGVTSVLLSGGNGSLCGTSARVDLVNEPKVLSPEVASEILMRSGGGRFGGDADTDDMAGGQQRPQRPQEPAGYAYPGTLFGIFGLMRQTLADAQFYSKQTAPKADPTLEGLKPLVTGKIPGLFTLSNARDIARAAHVADEFGFKMIINGAPDGYRMIDVLKAHRAPVILAADLPDEPRKVMADEPDATPQRVLDARWDLWKERTGNAKLLNEAGIPLAFRGVSLSAVRKLIAAGLPRDAALKAMTVNPAAIFGVSDQLGTIEPGKLANLVIMTGDFADAKSIVKEVFVEGVRFNAEKKESTK